jgi:competence protein ComEC
MTDTRKPAPPARVAPLMPVALAAAGGVVLDRYAEPWGTFAWVVMAAAGGVIGLVMGRWGRVAAVAVLGAWGALAGAWHHHRWSDLAGDDLARVVGETPRPAWVRGVLRDVQGFRPGSEPEMSGATRAVLEVTEVQSGGAWVAASGRAMMTVVGDRSDLRAGDAVEAAGSLALVPRPLNPGEFDYRNYLRAQGVRLRLVVDGPEGVWSAGAGVRPAHGWVWGWTRLLGTVRAWSQERLARAIDPASAPLAQALLLGRGEGVDPDVNDAFARTGTTHLLAISGLHLQVLALALGTALRLTGLGRRGTFAAVAAATVAYALLVGLMPSVVRSAAMTVTYCAAGWCDRRARPANTLALAALVTLGLNPAHLFDVGCQLSFLAVGAIAWGVAPVVARVLREPDPLTRVERMYAPGWKKRLRRAWVKTVEGLTVSTVVWLAAVPLVALRFHLVSPIGVLLNVPLIPLTSLALLASGVALGLSAVWDPLGWPAGWVCSKSLWLTDLIVRWGASQRWGSLFVAGPPWGWVLTFYGLLGLAAAAGLGQWKWRWGAWGLLVGSVPVGLALALGIGAGAAAHAPEADVLAVGHGLAVVLSDRPGRAVLYDCGRMRDPSVGRRVIAPALWARGVDRLDAVILSHADADHYNGLPDLLDRFRVGAVLVPPGFDAGGANPGAAELLRQVRARGVAVRTVAAGERWGTGDGFSFRVRHPARESGPATGTDNARSVVLDVAAFGRHALLTGDLEGSGLTALAARARDRADGPLDVFLAPHHGGRTANPEWLYAWAGPARVVVSQRPPTAGARDALAPLEARGVPVLRTWQRGAVRLRWTAAGIEARGFLDGEGAGDGDENNKKEKVKIIN